MESRPEPKDIDSSEGQLAADFARMLAANFSRQTARREDEAGKEARQDSREDVTAPPSESIEGEENNQGAEGGPPRDRSLTAPVNNRKGPRLASSRFRGCTRHRRTKRYEAHIWDQRQQRYLGGFDKEADAGKAHDVMALKCRMQNEVPQLNFPMENYSELLPFIDALPKDEVVAQLRQLNRTTPRPKARKPLLRTRTSPKLGSLGTRSGGFVKRRPALGRESLMMIPQEAMASYCRAHKLLPVRLGREPVPQMARYPSVRSLPELSQRGGPQTPFANEKATPQPHWAPQPLEHPLSPDLLDLRTHLGDPSDLLADLPDSFHPSAKPSPGHQHNGLRSQQAQLSPGGPLYIGRTLTPRASQSWMAREPPPLLAGHTNSLPEPLPRNFEQTETLSSATSPSLTAGNTYQNSFHAATKPVAAQSFHAQAADTSYSLSAGSVRYSGDSGLTQFGPIQDFGSSEPLGLHTRQGWEPQGGHLHEGAGRQPVGGSIMGGRWPHSEGSRWESEFGMPKLSGFQSSRVQSPGSTVISGQSALSSPKILHRYDTGFVSGPGVQLEPGLPLNRFVEHQSSFTEHSTAEAQRQWGKPGLEDGPGQEAPDLFLAGIKTETLPLDQSGASFMQMLGDDIPTSEQLDAAVMDVMGKWSP